MNAPIGDSWNRIEAWLAQHAPATFAGLEAPAAPEAIEAAETAVGMPFPDELRHSLRRHDGTGYHGLLAPFYRLQSAQEIAATWELHVAVHEQLSPPDGDEDESAPPSDHGPWWHRKWIPFAADDGGDHLVIDQRPSPVRGRVGLAARDDGGHFRQRSAEASLAALFEATATALETGDRLDGYRPLVDGEGELDWEHPPVVPQPQVWQGRGRRAAESTP